MVFFTLTGKFLLTSNETSKDLLWLVIIGIVPYIVLNLLVNVYESNPICSIIKSYFYYIFAVDLIVGYTILKFWNWKPSIDENDDANKDDSDKKITNNENVNNNAEQEKQNDDVFIQPVVDQKQIMYEKLQQEKYEQKVQQEKQPEKVVSKETKSESSSEKPKPKPKKKQPKKEKVISEDLVDTEIQEY